MADKNINLLELEKKMRDARSRTFADCFYWSSPEAKEAALNNKTQNTSIFGDGKRRILTRIERDELGGVAFYWEEETGKQIT